MPDAPAVYFVRPTAENIQRIVDDCSKQVRCLTYSLTYSLTHLLTHSLTHAFRLGLLTHYTQGRRCEGMSVLETDTWYWLPDEKVSGRVLLFILMLVSFHGEGVCVCE